jgi:hypothetical protein
VMRDEPLSRGGVKPAGGRFARLMKSFPTPSVWSSIADPDSETKVQVRLGGGQTSVQRTKTSEKRTYMGSCVKLNKRGRVISGEESTPTIPRRMESRAVLAIPSRAARQ